MTKTLLYLSGLFLAFAIVSCNQCKDVECLNEGICEDGICQCANGFSGDSCQIEDKCITENVNCLNDGICENGKCDCVKDYYGESCEVFCEEGRYRKNSGECECYPGYDDETCSIEMRLDWIADYTVNTDCKGITVQSTITAMEHPDPDSAYAANYVSITNLSVEGDTKGYGIILDGNMLEVPRQSVKASNGDKFTVESTNPVSLSGGNFTLTVERKFDGFSVLCTNQYTRN